jgi:hypothetical protein
LAMGPDHNDKRDESVSRGGSRRQVNFSEK